MDLFHLSVPSFRPLQRLVRRLNENQSQLQALTAKDLRCKDMKIESSHSLYFLAKRLLSCRLHCLHCIAYGAYHTKTRLNSASNFYWQHTKDTEAHVYVYPGLFFSLHNYTVIINASSAIESDPIQFISLVA